MADCIECGKKIGFTNRGDFGRCSSCTAKHWEQERIPEQARMDAKYAAEAARNIEIDAVTVTTETHTNLTVANRIKIIVAAVESSFDAKLVEKQDELVFGLKTECHAVGENAVVGVTFNIIETYSASIGAGNFKKFKMVAYGTAVVVET